MNSERSPLLQQTTQSPAQLELNGAGSDAFAGDSRNRSLSLASIWSNTKRRLSMSRPGPGPLELDRRQRWTILAGIWLANFLSVSDFGLCISRKHIWDDTVGTQ